MKAECLRRQNNSNPCESQDGWKKEGHPCSLSLPDLVAADAGVRSSPVQCVVSVDGPFSPATRLRFLGNVTGGGDDLGDPETSPSTRPATPPKRSGPPFLLIGGQQQPRVHRRRAGTPSGSRPVAPTAGGG